MDNLLPLPHRNNQGRRYRHCATMSEAQNVRGDLINELPLVKLTVARH
jgi:hypothetical protein